MDENSGAHHARTLGQAHRPAPLRDAFRVATQVPNAESPETDEARLEPRLPYWLYVERSPATAFSRYDLRKMTEGSGTLILTYRTITARAMAINEPPASRRRSSALNARLKTAGVRAGGW